MSNKNMTAVTYFRNPSLKSHTVPAQPYSLSRHQSNHYQQSVKKSSLVFLSTLMQIEKSNITDLQQNSKRQSQPEQATTLITYQPESPSPRMKHRIQPQYEHYYASKAKKMQNDERSITNLIGMFQPRRPNMKEILFVSKTLERNRTFTTIPVEKNQGSTERKIESKKMGDGFYELMLKKNQKVKNQKKRGEQKGFTEHDRKEIINRANHIANIYSQFKVNSNRARMLTQATQSRKTPKSCSQSVSIPSRPPKKQNRQFRWTRIGSRQPFKLKTTPI